MNSPSQLNIGEIRKQLHRQIMEEIDLAQTIDGGPMSFDRRFMLAVHVDQFLGPVWKRLEEIEGK